MKLKYLFILIIFCSTGFSSVFPQSLHYSLPTTNHIVPDVSDINEDFVLTFYAYPVAVTYSSILTLADKKVLSLPILMEDENLPVKSYSKLMNPNRWTDHVYTRGTGRSSIWFMERGEEMLYSILLDLNSVSDEIGIGYLSVIRLTDDLYDWFLRGPNEELLYVVRGEKIVLDESVGSSTFISLENQDDVKEKYDFLWQNLPPHKFVMFTR